MTGALEDLSREYALRLERFLRDRSEMSLSAGYELGREGIAQGLGVLDMAAVHYEALRTIPHEAATLEWLGAANDFFRELLSPFEMTFRGYRDTNDQLQTLNRELVEQKGALELVNRELESFSYSVSHDLRAPLRSLDGFSQALLEDYDDKLDDTGRKYLGYVRESAQEMAELIDGMLSLARITRSDFRRARVDLAALARRIADRLIASEPARTVEFVIPPEMIAYGDAQLLKVVLENLLGNAWKFTSKRADARVELGLDRGGYFVRDNGAGFDMTYAAKLFGVFQRLHPASEFEGTGIGLATVQRVIRRHGGQVWAESEPGRGATFFFTLGDATPVAPASSEKQERDR